MADFFGGDAGKNPWFWQALQIQAENDRIARENAAAAEQQRLLQQQQAQQLADQQAAAAAAAAQAPPAPAAPPFDPNPYYSQIDTPFNVFTPEFYSGQYSGALTPQTSEIGKQYGEAKDTLSALFAGRGLTGSKNERGIFQQLDALQNQATEAAQGRAQTYSDTLKSSVDTARSGLRGKVAAGSPELGGLGSAAQTKATELAGSKYTQPSLGSLFGDLLSAQGIYAGKQPTLPTAGEGFVNPSQQAYAQGSNLNLANAAGGPSAQVVADKSKKKKFA